MTMSKYIATAVCLRIIQWIGESANSTLSAVCTRIHRRHTKPANYQRTVDLSDLAAGGGPRRGAEMDPVPNCVGKIRGTSDSTCADDTVEDIKGRAASWSALEGGAAEQWMYRWRATILWRCRTLNSGGDWRLDLRSNLWTVLFFFLRGIYGPC